MPSAGAVHQAWTLSPKVHAVAIGEDLVLLDVLADGYFALPGAACAVDFRGGCGALSFSDPDIAEALCSAGLVEHGPARNARATQTSAPTARRSALRALTDGPAVGDVGEALAALYDLSRTYRGRSFADILASADPGERAAPPTLSSGLLDVVHRFHRWIPYAPVSGKCLLRAFMLLRLLRRSGHDALWVFGVRTWPFHAHCWLQCEDVVLDDQPDRVAAYTPILVI